MSYKALNIGEIDTDKFTLEQKEELKKEVNSIKMMAAVYYALLSEHARVLKELEKIRGKKKIKDNVKRLMVEYMFISCSGAMVRYNAELSAMQNLLGIKDHDKFIKECVELLEKESGNIWKQVLKQK